MSTKPMALPWVLLALDAFGAALVILGVLALTGNDFGYPVLKTVAPGLIAIGLALFVPLGVWAVRLARARRGK